MIYKNLTITGKTDGFGCQYNAVLSGMAFCDKHNSYRYVHTPFYSVSHGYESKENVDKLNQLIGMPAGRAGKKIHAKYPYMKKVFNNINNYYTDSFISKVRSYYWNGKNAVDSDIVVHIRRGDMNKNYRLRGGTRYQTNDYYNKLIPRVIKPYPDHYKIVIHSEGDYSEFESMTKGWPQSIINRLVWKLGKKFQADCEFDTITAFHEMVCAKVLIQSKSGMSFTAGVLNKNDVYFMSKSISIGQKIPLKDWKTIT